MLNLEGGYSKPIVREVSLEEFRAMILKQYGFDVGGDPDSYMYREAAPDFGQRMARNLVAALDRFHRN